MGRDRGRQEPGRNLVARSAGLGRMRTDLLLVWPAGGARASALAGEGRVTQKVVVECKGLRRELNRTVREGLEQTRAYMDRSGAAEGHLEVFDRTEGRPWNEKIFRRGEAGGGVTHDQRVLVSMVSCHSAMTSHLAPGPCCPPSIVSSVRVR